MVDMTIKKGGREGRDLEWSTKGQEAEGSEIPSSQEDQPIFATRRASVSPDVVVAGLFELLRRCAESMSRFPPGAGVPAGLPWSPPTSGLWFPPIEIVEEHGYFTVCVELPGLKKDDISVALTDEGLVISGQRKPADPERVQGIHRSERSYGSFSRTIPIPDEADIEKTTATYENGLLTVSIPVPEGSHWRREVPVGP